MKWCGSKELEVVILFCFSFTMVIAKADKEWIENNFVSATKLTALINDAVAAAIRPLQATIDGLTKTLNEKNKRIEDLESQLNESVARNSALIQQRADDNEQYSKKQNLKYTIHLEMEYTNKTKT